jgi:hypothetical protein
MKKKLFLGFMLSMGAWSMPFARAQEPSLEDLPLVASEFVFLAPLGIPRHTRILRIQNGAVFKQEISGDHCSIHFKDYNTVSATRVIVGGSRINTKHVHISTDGTLFGHSGSVKRMMINGKTIDEIQCPSHFTQKDLDHHLKGILYSNIAGPFFVEP